MKTIINILLLPFFVFNSTYDIAQELKTFSRHLTSVWGIDVSPDGKFMVSASGDKNLKIWNLSNGTFYVLTGHKSTVWDAKYTSNGKYLLSSSADYSILMWDINTKKCLHMFNGHEWDINSIDVSSDSKKLASGSTDKTIKIWDLENKRLIRTLSGHNGSVNKVIFSPNNQRLVSCSGDKTLKIWDLESGRSLHTLTGHTELVASATYSKDGKKIVSVGWDNHIKVWNANTGKLENDIICNIDMGIDYNINNVILSKNGKYLICSCSDFFQIKGQLISVNIKTKEIKKILFTPVNQINDLMISNSGKELFGAMENGTIKMWDISNIN